MERRILHFSQYKWEWGASGDEGHTDRRKNAGYKKLYRFYCQNYCRLVWKLDIVRKLNNRHSGASRNPENQYQPLYAWIPAFAGMTG